MGTEWEACPRSARTRLDCTEGGKSHGVVCRTLELFAELCNSVDEVARLARALGQFIPRPSSLSSPHRCYPLWLREWPKGSVFRV